MQVVLESTRNMVNNLYGSLVNDKKKPVKSVKGTAMLKAQRGEVKGGTLRDQARGMFSVPANFP
jgi:hypothetical protein